MMKISLAALVMVFASASVGSTQTGQSATQSTALSSGTPGTNTVIVRIAAPIFIGPDAVRQPLRVAKEGSALHLIQREGDWCLVEFQDPEYGRRVGYIQTRFVQLLDRTLEPVDVSVPEAKPADQSVPPPVREVPVRAATPTVAQRATSRAGMPTKHKVWGGILLGLSAYYLVSYAVTEPNRINCDFGDVPIAVEI